VSKSALNKPLPLQLILEARRLEALEHNTKVRYGFLNEPLVDVPDAESFLGTEEYPRNLLFNVLNNKRKSKESEPPTSKRKKHSKDERDQSPASSFALSSWDSVNYSCAYDAMMSVFLVIFESLPPAGLQHVINESDLAATFFALFATVDRKSVNSFNNLRNTMRNLLSQADDSLPRWGTNLASFDQIVSLLVNVHSLTLSQKLHCQLCHNIQSSTLWQSSVGSVLTDSVWNRTYNGDNHLIIPTSTQYWMNALEQGTWRRAKKMDEIMLEGSVKCVCVEHLTNMSVNYIQHPSIIFMDIPRELDDSTFEIQPTITSALANCTYTLRAIVYLGAAHYTTHLFKEGEWYKHDGQHNAGWAVRITNSIGLASRDEQDRKACGLFYSL
jgi:hypothetical protein